ncbi:hypothetical protein [Vulcanisaeta sp. JCM 14467]|uniref:hypothetical protein n=1 Tax=Vulcanisaeta sp. JCM 14467 TaxID=1295370 RepID=UPI0020923E59|nr:hypothetical protein [Vulcanisaeta sp. JCM 14467]
MASGSVGAVAAPVQTAILADKTEGMDRSVVYAIFNLVSGIASAIGALLANLSYLETFYMALALSAVSYSSCYPSGRNISLGDVLITTQMGIPRQLPSRLGGI